MAIDCNAFSGKPSFPAPIDPTLGENTLHATEAFHKWQGNVIGERERSSSRATLAAVDGNVIDTSFGRFHQLRQVFPETDLPNCRLDADR